MNSKITKPTSDFLTDLASGKYDAQVAAVEKILALLAPEFPVAGELLMILRGFVTFNKLTAPRSPIVPDGKGGWVPASNSKIGSDGKFI